MARGFTKPRQQHSWLGLPSVTISACVARNRIIMWRVQSKSWCGALAAETYAGPMMKALRRTWGHRRFYTIVEDGDRKGNQSGKGVAAKATLGIRSMTLPPRTPSWMPLDYALWDRIQKDVLEAAPDGRESKASYIARLEKAAKALPRAYVAKVVGRMKASITVVIEANGYHPKND